MKRFLFFAFILSISTIFVIGQGQSTSGITGLVADANGAGIPGVKVTLTDTKTGRTLDTTTNDQGNYAFHDVPPGAQYKLSFATTGFKTTNVANVTLGVARTETYDAVLSPGDVAATVDVAATSSGETLNTTDASIGNVISTQQLRELPIQIRESPAALIGLQPGVIGNNVGTGNVNRVGSVIGSRADQGNITVDGIDANDQATGQFAATVGNAPIDAIQEFRAVTANPSAAEGRSSGGQVELLTKSGTNQYHGSLREYNRNTEFAANDFFLNQQGNPRAKLNRNQYGGNLGGPLPRLNFGENNGPMFKSGKDKLFFFFDYEGRRDASDATYTRIVPTQAFRNGQLSYLSNTGVKTLTAAEVAGLDPRGIGADPAMLSFINSRYPMPNNFTVGDGLNTAGFTFNTPAARADANYTSRIDANITDTQHLFVRMNIAHRNQDDTVNSVAAQFPGDPTAAQIVVRDWSLAGGYTWVINPHITNQLTLGNSHSGLDFPNGFHPAFPNRFTFGQLSAPFADISTQSRNVDTPTYRDDVTWTKGNHTFFFGGLLKPIKSVSGLVNDLNDVSVGLGGNLNELDPSLRPNDIADAGVAAYDAAFPFLLGRFAQLNTAYTYNVNGTVNPPGTGKVRDYRYNEWEAYIQDNWKIRPNLTINLGVRYSYDSPPYEKNGFQAGNDVDLNQLFATRVANNAAGLEGDSVEPFLSYSLIGKGNNARPVYKPDRNNFGPRIGFNYSPSFSNGFLKSVFGDRKTSIRGGAAVVYDRVSGALTFIQDQLSYLFDNSASTSFGQLSPVASLLNDPRFTGIATLPVNNVAPTITNPNTPFVQNGVPFGLANDAFNYTIAQNFQTPYSYEFSLGFQRELRGNMLLDVSYAGRRGKKLFTQADAAQVLDFKDVTSGQTYFQAVNALQAQLAAGVAPGSVTNQPFFENQGANALFPCALPQVGGSCTRLVALFAGSLVSRGDTGDLIQFLNANGVVPNNVANSAQFADNIYISNLGHSRYDGLLVSLRKRFSKGFQFDANYTYSFSKDNNSSVANTVIGGLIYDLTNPNIGYGPSDFDIRHLFNANWIWELPFGHGKWIGGSAKGWENQLIGGWELSGIFTARSGLPFSVGTNSFPVSFTLETPAVLVGSAPTGNINTSGSTVNFFGDAAAASNALAAFRNVHAGETGSRNVLRGPGFWGTDIGLAKNFKMGETKRIQLRMDAFNAFNHNVFANPNVTLFGASNTSFGQITTSASTPREIQFAARFDF